MKYIVILLLLTCVNAQLYHRIDKYEVSNEIINFLYNNHLNDCFKHQERVDQLYLKCWKNNMLYEVEIISKPYEKYTKKTYLSITV